VGSGPPLRFSRRRPPGAYLDSAEEQRGGLAPIVGVHCLDVLCEKAQLLLSPDEGRLDAPSRKRGEARFLLNSRRTRNSAPVECVFRSNVITDSGGR
jgi:hypothetical protein